MPKTVVTFEIAAIFRGKRTLIGTIPVEFTASGDTLLMPGKKRQREIVARILEGSSNKEIAGDLNVAESTVKFHVGNIFKAFGVASRVELIAKLRTT